MALKKQSYWFRILIGKWEDDSFDPEVSFVFVEAWDAKAAIRKAENNTEITDEEVITGVVYVGYPQV